jgi:hypothetical protein
MRLWAGLAVLWVVGGVLTPAHAQTELKWNLRAGEQFFVQSVNTLKNTSKQDGEEYKLDMEITTVESYKVLRADTEGVVLEKTILSQKLKSSSAELEKSAETVAKKLEGAVLTIAFDPGMQKVTRIEGMKNYMKRLMDDENADSRRHEETIKEEQQNIFTGFLPDKPVMPGQQWQRMITHASSDPAASYTADARYVFKGTETVDGKLLALIDALWAVTFTLPKPSIKTDLTAEPAKATYFFDAAAGRLAKSDRYFRVKGKITTAQLGKETISEIDQDQTWRIRLTSENPLTK